MHNSWDNLTKQDEEDAALGEDCNQDCDFEIVISKSQKNKLSLKKIKQEVSTQSGLGLVPLNLLNEDHILEYQGYFQCSLKIGINKSYLFP